MNTTLIGMSGVGKSLLGKKLSEKLNYFFYDGDIEISNILKKNIQQFLDEVGEEKFLKYEGEVLNNISMSEPFVFSPGGSIIYNPHVLEKYRKISKIIHLKFSWNRYIQMIKNPQKRGIVGLKDRSLEELFHERLALYDSFADIIFPLDNYWTAKRGFKMKRILKDLGGIAK